MEWYISIYFARTEPSWRTSAKLSASPEQSKLTGPSGEWLIESFIHSRHMLASSPSYFEFNYKNHQKVAQFSTNPLHSFSDFSSFKGSGDFFLIFTRSGEATGILHERYFVGKMSETRPEAEAIHKNAAAIVRWHSIAVHKRAHCIWRKRNGPERAEALSRVSDVLENINII